MSKSTLCINLLLGISCIGLLFSGLETLRLASIHDMCYDYTKITNYTRVYPTCTVDNSYIGDRFMDIIETSEKCNRLCPKDFACILDTKLAVADQDKGVIVSFEKCYGSVNDRLFQKECKGEKCQNISSSFFGILFSTICFSATCGLMCNQAKAAKAQEPPKSPEAAKAAKIYPKETTINISDDCAICQQLLISRDIVSILCSKNGNHLFHVSCYEEFKSKYPDRICVICH